MAAQSVIHLTQSRYYSPVFNAAVFDGPIRIYFAQHQETLALRVYFRLQQHLKDVYTSFRNSFKQHGQTVFLMLYPTGESFANSFGADSSGRNVVAARLGEDHVIGVRGPLEDDQYDEVFEQVKAILQVLGLTPEFASPSA
jgi:hypothetical protein